MAPSFLRDIGEPQVYNAVEGLVRLWEEMCDRAEGRPWEAHEDIVYSALDFIFASAFGLAEEIVPRGGDYGLW
jgi:hypothetical protein